MGVQGGTPLLDLTRLARLSLQAVPKAPKEAPQGRAGGRAAGALGTYTESVDKRSAETQRNKALWASCKCANAAFASGVLTHGN